MKETRRETAQRIERLLDAYGFCDAISLIAKSAADTLSRGSKLEVLRQFERDMQSYVEEELQCVRENKLKAIDALADDERGNENERDTAKVMGEKIRAEMAASRPSRARG